MPLPISPGGRRYGYLRDKTDTRDFTLKLMAPTARPPFCDLEPWCGPHYDQGSEGSCTANAGVTNREFLIRKFPEFEPGLQGLDPKTVSLSRAYLYYASRLYDGDPNDDNGSYGRTVCRVLNAHAGDVKMRGVCLDSTMPYRAGDYATPPSSAAVTEALRFTAGAYHRLYSGSTEAISCLVSGYPVLLGFTVFESFESGDVERTGIVPMPGPDEYILGGHEVLVIGYNDGPNAVNGKWPAGYFKVRNSWGSSWGDGGDFYVPYQFLDNTRTVIDLWMQHLGRSW